MSDIEKGKKRLLRELIFKFLAQCLRYSIGYEMVIMGKKFVYLPVVGLSYGVVVVGSSGVVVVESESLKIKLIISHIAS